MKKLIFLSIFCLGILPVVESQDSRQILERMEDVMRGDNLYAEMTMTIERPRYEREISISSWHIGNDYSMILVTAPARDRGTSFLMRENNIWTYDPRIDRVTRLPSSMMSQSWMGSDFTNDDLVRDSDVIEDYEHRVVRTEVYEGLDCYVLELIPRPETPIVWGKVKMWVVKDSYIQLRMEQYDQEGELVNEIRLSEIKTFGDREVPSKMVVIPVDKKGHKTILEYRLMDFDAEIEVDFFDRRNMQRLQ
ncbi:MAG: outer membrane lipoprotein-sorting protein [Saprospirales bacterium]|nr:MAG: outer membrane lipoprotein-sorting protein [Saprospirales bacterium]